MISGLERPSRSAPFDVGAGPRVRAHAGEHDPPQGVVGLPVAAPVEPVTGHLAGRGVDRGDPAEVGEGGLGGDPFGVVAGGDEQQGGGADADTVQVEQARGGRLDEVGELTVEAGAIGVDVDDTATEGAASPAWWHTRRGHRCGSGAAPRRSRRDRRRDIAEPFPQLIGGAEAEMAQLVETLDAGVAPGAVGDEQHPDRLDVAIGSLGHRRARPDSAARAASTASMLSDLP